VSGGGGVCVVVGIEQPARRDRRAAPAGRAQLRRAMKRAQREIGRTAVRGGVGAAAKRGFTLLEMMMVVMIMGLLATVIVVNISGRSEQARVQLTKTQLSQIKTSLIEYQVSNGTYPPSLAELVAAKLMDKIPQDQWKRALYYAFPGTSGNADQPYDLYSFGADGLSATTDDINVWTMDSK
jgi:general secretion pathway protein G